MASLTPPSDFSPSPTFEGPRDGCEFKLGPDGLGYYTTGTGQGMPAAPLTVRQRPRPRPPSPDRDPSPAVSAREESRARFQARQEARRRAKLPAAEREALEKADATAKAAKDEEERKAKASEKKATGKEKRKEKKGNIPAREAQGTICEDCQALESCRALGGSAERDCMAKRRWMKVCGSAAPSARPPPYMSPPPNITTIRHHAKRQGYGGWLDRIEYPAHSVQHDPSLPTRRDDRRPRRN